MMAIECPISIVPGGTGAFLMPNPALTYMATFIAQLGRDVGFAKSGFRPTKRSLFHKLDLNRFRD
jgi:hypothetical protein